MRDDVPVSWAQIVLVVVGAMMVAAAAYWAWLALNFHRRPGPRDRLDMLVLTVGAIDYFGAGVAFVVAGVLRNRYFMLAGASLLILRYLAFRWIGRRTESQA